MDIIIFCQARQEAELAEKVKELEGKTKEVEALKRKLEVSDKTMTWWANVAIGNSNLPPASTNTRLHILLQVNNELAERKDQEIVSKDQEIAQQRDRIKQLQTNMEVCQRM